jgi:hypothetical protein
MWSKEGLQAAIDLLSQCKKDPNLSVSTGNSIRVSMSLALIGLGRFNEAVKVFGTVRPAPQDLDIQEAFNYGMAEWGKTGTPPKDMFEWVVSLDSKRDKRYGANYYQCLAIALWVVGRNQDSLEYIKKAEDQIAEKPTPEFSCWRYMKVTPPEFREDCESTRKLTGGEKIQPKFLPESSRG